MAQPGTTGKGGTGGASGTGGNAGANGNGTAGAKRGTQHRRFRKHRRDGRRRREGRRLSTTDKDTGPANGPGVLVRQLWSRYCSRSAIFSSLPVAVCGSSSTKTTSSGSHHLATSPAR